MNLGVVSAGNVGFQNLTVVADRMLKGCWLLIGHGSIAGAPGAIRGCWSTPSLLNRWATKLLLARRGNAASHLMPRPIGENRKLPFLVMQIRVEKICWLFDGDEDGFFRSDLHGATTGWADATDGFKVSNFQIQNPSPMVASIVAVVASSPSLEFQIGQDEDGCCFEMGSASVGLGRRRSMLVACPYR